MRVLGLDTATSTASVALIENGRVIAEEISPRPQSGKHGQLSANHAEAILPLIETLLQRAALSLTELSGLAVSIGPGSFTGLRIGLSTVKGLAYGWGIPVVGVSTLLANAARVTDFEGLICSFLDARKKQVYAALFRRAGGNFHRITEDSVHNPGEVIDLVRNFKNHEPCLFIGEGTIAYEKLLVESFGKGVTLRRGDTLPSVASAIARLGEGQCRSSSLDVLASLAPLYLRSSEVEVKQKNSTLTN
jgi:tRNA threonylcarbamoyladenosine biosynthesis protein TsaB